MANLKDVIYLSNEDYETLVSTGTVTIDGDTLTYDENNVYITPEVVASSTQDGLMSASDKIKLDGVDTTYLPLTGGTMTGMLTVKSPIFGYEYNVSSNNAAFILDKPGSNYSGIGSHAETDTIYFGACGSTGAWVDSYKQKWKFNGTIIEDGTALADKYGQLSAVNTWTSTQGIKTTSVPALELKNISSSGGAFIDYENNNQTTNYWRVGMRSDGPFSFAYNGSVMASISTSGSIYENGTALSSKYLGISAKAADSSKLNGQEASYYLNYNNLTNKPTIPTTYVSTVNGASGAIINVAKTNTANTFTGNNTFSGAFSATDGASLSADSGDVVLSVDPSGIIFNSRYGVHFASPDAGSYHTSASVIRYSSGVTPSDSLDLTNKGYVDNNFVNKSSNQTGIAGQKSWTGNQIWYVTGSNGEIYQSLNANGVSGSWSDSDLMHNAGWSLNNNVSFYANNEEAARYQNFTLNTSSDHILMSSTDMGGDTSGDVILSDSQFTVSFGNTSDPTVPVLIASQNGVVVPNLYKTYTNASTNNPYLDRTAANGLYVDKTSNQTGIAGNKTWTGNQVWSGSAGFASGVSASKSASNKAGSSFIVGTEAIYLSVSDSEYVYSDDDTGVNASFFYSGTQTNKKPAFDIYTQSNYSMYYAGIISTNGESATLYYEDSDLFNNSSVQVKGREIILTSDHEGIGAVSTIFRNNGGFMYLGNSTDGWVSINDIISNITCFRGDTTYVTMYDGTKKLIKDVKTGDSLLGYNVNTKETCETVVLRNFKTGEERYYDCYVFSDGSTIDIYGNDTFLAKVKNRFGHKDADSDGETLDCYSISTLMSKHDDENDDSHLVIKEDGGSVFVVCSFKGRLKEYTPRYALYTSNGTAFVNGLCLCNVPSDILELRDKRGIQFSPDIDSILDGVAVELSELDESLPDDSIVDPSKIDDIKEYTKALAEVCVYKKKLSDLDYYTNKYIEQDLSDERWNEIHQMREEYREKVNTAEVNAAEYKAKAMESNPQVFGYSSGENKRWKKVQATFDSHIEDFKEWAIDYKEKQEKVRAESLKRKEKIYSP